MTRPWPKCLGSADSSGAQRGVVPMAREESSRSEIEEEVSEEKENMAFVAKKKKVSIARGPHHRKHVRAYRSASREHGGAGAARLAHSEAPAREV